MTNAPDVSDVASALQVSIGLFLRRIRQVKSEGDLTLPERSALGRLDRGGPSTSAALARVEQISPQSMGATLAALEARGLVERRPDPDDGRQIVLSLTESGRQKLQDRRSEQTQYLAQTLAETFSPVELEQLMTAAPLIERLAESL